MNDNDEDRYPIGSIAEQLILIVWISSLTIAFVGAILALAINI